MTLRWRAILTLGAIEIITLTVVIMSSLIYLHQEGQHQVEIRASEVGSLLKTAIGESLMIQHYASVGEVVDAAFSELDDIDYLAALDADGNLLASKRRGKDLGEDDDHLEMIQHIMIGSTRLGTIKLRYSTDYLIECLTRQGWTMATWGLLGILVSAIATYVATTRVTQGLASVTGRLLDVAQGGASPPLPVKKMDELGQLVVAYNVAIKNLIKKPL